MHQFRVELESVASQHIELLFNRVTKAREFHAGQWTEREYYKRHLVETVLRIRLNNEVDAYSLHKIAARDNILAQRLAQYLAEEYGHENMFLRDVQKFGVTKQEVDSTPPFQSTKELIGYMYLEINEQGPLPTMVWNWFVEWYSNRYNGVITRKAAQEYGEQHVKGSLAHIGYDDSHDHDDMMFGAVQRALKRPGDEEKAKQYLKNYINLVARYFQELYESTVASNRAADVSAIAM